MSASSDLVLGRSRFQALVRQMAKDGGWIAPSRRAHSDSLEALVSACSSRHQYSVHVLVRRPEFTQLPCACAVFIVEEPDGPRSLHPVLQLRWQENGVIWSDAEYVRSPAAPLNEARRAAENPRWLVGAALHKYVSKLDQVSSTHQIFKCRLDLVL